jgi:hypothetical protein
MSLAGHRAKCHYEFRGFTRALAVALLCASAGVAASPPPAVTGNPVRSWNFEAGPPGTLPKDFLVGTLFDGRPAGDWRVIAALDAPSPPNVLAQQMGKGAEHAYKVVLVDDTAIEDVELEVSFLDVAGKGDMGGSLIWRAKDDRNYYLTRANPLEQNIRTYRVVNGVRQQLANSNKIITARQWHTLRVLSLGDHFQVFYDGSPAIDVHDKTYTAGRIGLWTKSDAVTYFDNLRLQPVK